MCFFYQCLSISSLYSDYKCLVILMYSLLQVQLIFFFNVRLITCDLIDLSFSSGSYFLFNFCIVALVHSQIEIILFFFLCVSMPAILFSCVPVLARPFSVTLNSNDEKRHLCLIPNHSGKTFFHHYVY